ncbi:MAG: glycosyltransferase family 9 protein, partial [Thermodesulfovibrionia bacterium]|nr:glycosyltransferase family 9 protein [Thermodesulfovibrionia bacterium]
MKILIIKPSSLGDVIHSLPFLKSLKNTLPESHIEWIISKDLKDILEGNPLINKLVVFNKDAWRGLRNFPEFVRDIRSLIKTLKSGHYDMVIDLQGLLRSGLMTFFSSSPLKIGFLTAREGGSLFYNKKISVNGSLHAVNKYLEVAKSVGAQIERVEFPLSVDDTASRKIKTLIGNLSEYVVIVPSARWETKKWPPEYFGMLISKLSIPCVITGSNSDKLNVQRVLASSRGKGINLCGKTNLKELTALIAGAKAVVSNDSGPVHIGAALGVPVVALFGPTDPVKTGPYGWSGVRSERKNKHLTVVKIPLPCSPCFKKKC